MSGTDYAKEGIVHIENLVKRYGSLVALDHLNLDIRCLLYTSRCV